MTKFNKAVTVEQRYVNHPDATTNYEDGLAFKVNAETELYLRACTSLLEDKFYTSAETHLAETRALIHQCDRKFVLQLANYVRNRMHLRSMPIVLLAEASVMQSSAREPKTDVRDYVPKIIRRADEPAELLAYWIANLGGGTDKKLPHALRNGLSTALDRFEEYHLAKYNRAGAVTLKDVLRLVHPVPKNEERSALYNRVMKDELATPDTWEVLISTKGSTKENWDKVAESMGIMGLLRNLRNFEQNGAEKALAIAKEQFSNPEVVRNSKQLPFRWYQAHKHVTRNDVKDAILQALDLSLECVEPWNGDTAIFSDNSSSMCRTLSDKGETRYIEVAALMSAMATALSPEGYRVGVFGHHFAWVPSVSRRDSVLTNMERVYQTDVGYSTEAWKCLDAMRREQVKADRVVLFSDMQCYNTHGSEALAPEWKKYRQEINPKAILYSVDLAGYGTSQFPQGDSGVVLLSGWSEGVLDFVRFYEQGKTALDEIRANW